MFHYVQETAPNVMLHYVQKSAEYKTLHYVLEFIVNMMWPIFMKF
jgi:hypothetical protein